MRLIICCCSPLRFAIVLCLLSAEFVLCRPAAGQRHTVAGEHFSHAIFDSLLQSNIQSGDAYYAAFDVPHFHQYLCLLESAAPEHWGKSEQSAFWLNAYNAVFIRSVLQRPGMKILSGTFGFTRLDSVVVAGTPHTLESLCALALSSTANPSVLFGMAHLGGNGVGLPRRAYRAAFLEKALQEQTRKILQSKEGSILDMQEKALYVSNIFLVFGNIFPNERQLLLFARNYLANDAAAYTAVHESDLSIRFLPPETILRQRFMRPQIRTVKPYNQR